MSFEKLPFADAERLCCPPWPEFHNVSVQNLSSQARYALPAIFTTLLRRCDRAVVEALFSSIEGRWLDPAVLRY